MKCEYIAMSSENAQDPCWNEAARIRCQFTFKCPQIWDRLTLTGKEGIRHCSACDRDVYLVVSEEDLQRHAEARHCVAVKIERKPGIERDLQTFVGVIRSRYGESAN
jgi:hypothetical protein